MGRTRSKHGRTGMLNRCKTLLLICSLAALLLPNWAEAKKLNVITATTDLAALAQEVGGDKIQVESIAKGYQDPHFVEAKPSFLLKLRQADLLIVVGLQLEIGWLPPLINQSGNARIQVGAAGYLDASQFAEILDIPTGHRHARDGRRPSSRQSALLARSGQRTAHREGIRGQARRTRSAKCGVLPATLSGLRQAPDGGRAEVGCGHEAVSRAQGRDLSQFCSRTSRSISG